MTLMNALVDEFEKIAVLGGVARNVIGSVKLRMRSAPFIGFPSTDLGIVIEILPVILPIPPSKASISVIQSGPLR